jgi:hypothetical protein
MTTIKLIIKCRIEEESVLGKFLHTGLTNNLTAFAAFSPRYNAAYLANFNTKLIAVEALLNPKAITAQQKVITKRIFDNMDALRPKLDYLEGYINRATGLHIAPKDFGISAVRKDVKRGDVEGVIGGLNYLMPNVVTDMAALVAEGYTAAQHTALTTIKAALFTDNDAQNAKIDERNNLVEANYELFNEFWKMIMDVCDAGKRIFKNSAANKVDDFTIAALIRRIRQEQKKNKFTGVITLDGEAVLNAKVELIPITGGRRRTTKTDEDGMFVIKSLTDGEYLANVSGKWLITQSLNILIETGKTTTVNFEMEAENDTVNKPK